MKPIIVYASQAHGNTEKIARAMAEPLKAELVNVVKSTPKELWKYDLIGFGSGIYHFGFHEQIIALADELSKFAKPKIFIFSTSGVGKPRLNMSFDRHLIQRGFSVMANFACPGFDDHGIKKMFGGIAKDRPNALDLENARDFAANLMPAKAKTPV